MASEATGRFVPPASISDPAIRRVPRPATPRPNTGDSVVVISEGRLPGGPRLSTILIWAWNVFFLTIATLIYLGQSK